MTGKPLHRLAAASCAVLLVAPLAGAQDFREVKLRDGDDAGRYIVLLETPSLAERLAELNREAVRQGRQPLDSNGQPRPFRLDLAAPAARDWSRHIDERFAEFEAEAALALGRELRLTHRYRNATNGFSTRLTASEAKRLLKTPGVRSVVPDLPMKMHTDAGPQWIGADDIWNGAGFIQASRGEGVVVGVIDSGINWDHASFADPGENGAIGQHDHENPYGQQLGLCSQAGVECNDKLVGVYDFVEDNPDTETVEENNTGRDNTNHGTHVASIAVGNPLNVSLLGTFRPISGVAPNANLISYRVCYAGDPDDPEDDACQTSAVLAAVDQAIADGVDVINYSAGLSVTINPWAYPTDVAFLNARDAGIYVVTSAGNSGPGEGTVGNPAAAPWLVAAGSASHSRFIGSILNASSGGNTTPPGELLGDSNVDDGVATTDIVHAKDFGNALCGTGPEATEVPNCTETESASNPFPPGTFNGEIVVCDRGKYGRVEKGLNLMLAGAGGYVLANTSSEGESIVGDDHCLPSAHLGEVDGDALRDWLDTGTNHKASISGLVVVDRDGAGDRLSDFSSRGPNPTPVEDIMKPNLIAPGYLIVGASGEDDGFFIFNGTSMSSPHVAGAAALLKSLDSSLTPSQMASILETTSTDELAVDQNRNPATPNQVGSGRPQLGEAALAGLFLDVSKDEFLEASPAQGGRPRELNLPSMMNSNCGDSCSFKRTVKPLVNGRNWTATASGFPEDVNVSVTPSEFVLNSGGSQEIEVVVDLSGANVLGSWVFGQVELTANNLPAQRLPVVVFSSAGELPDSVTLSSDQDGGWETLGLSGLSALPQATFTAGGLIAPTVTVEAIAEDDTFGDPYDSPQGTFFVTHEVPPGALWLHARTPASPAEDLDLYVGRDLNGDGRPQPGEEVCFSADFFDIEQCDILSPEAGTWWILVQNFDDGLPGSGTQQDITLISGVISPGGNLSATGPGITTGGQAFDIRLAWQSVNATDGETLLGAVGVGSEAALGYNVGVIPITFERDGIGEAQTLPLMDGREAAFALAPSSDHRRAFIDVPPGASELTVTVDAATNAQRNNLELELFRMDFDDAFGQAPEAPDLGSPGAPIASATGGNGNGPSLSVSGASLEPGRWFAVVSNNHSSDAAVTLQADIEHSGDPIGFHPGLWNPVSRLGINQGFEYNVAGPNRAVIWYTYEESMLPAWYLSAAPSPDGNAWVADLLRFTNDGTDQAFTKVGDLAMTYIGEQDLVFSWTLFGISGSDRMGIISQLTCPSDGGNEVSRSGLWFRGVEGLGGASILVNNTTQAHIHYLFDALGMPRWLLGASDWDAASFDLLQYTGYCPTCTDNGTSNTVVGSVSSSFDSESQGSWTLDYTFDNPVTGTVNRTDGTLKITDRMDCE